MESVQHTCVRAGHWAGLWAGAAGGGQERTPSLQSYGQGARLAWLCGGASEGHSSNTALALGTG